MSESWAYDLAGIIKNTNKVPAAPLIAQVGKITKETPLTISMLDGKVMLSGVLLQQTKIFADQIKDRKSRGYPLVGLEVAVIGSQSYIALSLME